MSQQVVIRCDSCGNASTLGAPVIDWVRLGILSGLNEGVRSHGSIDLCSVECVNEYLLKTSTRRFCPSSLAKREHEPIEGAEGRWDSKWSGALPATIDPEKAIERLSDGLGDVNTVLDCKDLFGLKAHVVYAWIRQPEVLYVGVSSNGLSRLAQHHVIGAVEPIEEGDYLLLWAFDFEEEAWDAEKAAIERARPRFNGIPSSREEGLRTLVCHQCKATFKQRARHQVYCSAHCRNARTPNQPGGTT